MSDKTEDPVAPSYPESEKWRYANERAIHTRDFMEWLQGEKNVTLVTDHPELTGDFEYMPLNTSMDDLMMEYHEIDKDKLETERQAMLEAISG